MRVLILEDNQSKGEQLREALERAKHHATLAFDDYWEGLRDKAVALLEKDFFDVVVLDIHFSTDALGGFHVHNELVRRDARWHWGHTLLFTRYAIPKIEKATSGEAFWVRLFAETACIPFDCVFSKDAQDDLVKKIEQLANGSIKASPDVAPVDPDVIKDWQWIYRELQENNLARYKGQYIAVVNCRVVASGGNLDEVRTQACKASSAEKERVVMFWIDL
jgi:CheY-like chemotaxis protein